MNPIRFTLLFALAGCLPGTFPALPPDPDGDGYTVGDGDCDDTNGDINPATVWYEDVDGDAHGVASSTVTQCDAPEGFVLAGDDCDDTNADIRPEAAETCDGVDEDCDGTADNGAPGSDAYYTDSDGDTFGDDATETFSCTVLTDHVTVGGDCDDANEDSHPGASEVCDGSDNDCNTLVDDEATDGAVWFVDADEDGFGSAETDVFCDDPGQGYATKGGDCDDTDGAVEDYRLWYADLDKDGFGDAAAEAKACDAPVDHVSQKGDCVDTDDNIHPGAAEVCDDKDQDCDALIDDNPTDPTAWYLDADDDTYGAGAKTDACTAPTSQHVDQNGDCKDTDAAYFPGAPETCTDTVDFNCDGSIGAVDVDNDGFAACEECDDGNAAINPDATEICDAGGVDEDCNLLANDADSGVSDATRTSWYRDADVDNYGLTSDTKRACAKPAGYVSVLGDCNDAVGAVNPGAPEVCDALNADEDCDGSADNADASASGRTAYYADVDVDNHGNLADVQNLCDSVNGRVVSNDDCDDTKVNVHPGATEVCDAANLDEDCDNLADDADSGVSDATRTDWYFDGDTDNYGLTSNTTRKCDAPANYVVASGDCKDDNVAINPGAVEVCDALDADEDCDGNADNADSAPTGTSLFYKDADSDTHGDPSDSKALCDIVAGRVASNDDCNDASANIHPGAPELCDGVADDCGTGWVLADEAGVVTHFPTSGLATDLSAAWSAGSIGSLATITLPTSGRVSVCAGTYHVALTAASGAVELAGAGAATTALDGQGGTTRVLTVADGASVTASSVTLSHGVGGALVEGDASFTDVRFVDNAAAAGGGLLVDTLGLVTLDTCVLSTNAATTDGGGVYVALGTVDLVDSTVTLNTAAEDGAGLWSAGTLDLTETIVSHNTATGNGGGAFLENSTLSCTRTTVGGMHDNAALSGGAIYGRLAGFGVTSTACDWGVPTVNDNSPDDIVKEGTVIGTFGANATFVCTGASCL